MAASRPRRVRSLTARVLIVGTVWAAIALVVLALIITTLYRQNTERAFRELLRAQLYNVINSVWINREGELRGEPEFGDLRYYRPQTGWYWIVETIDSEAQQRKSSVSIGAGDLERPALSEEPFNAFYERAYDMVDPYGNHIVVVESEVELNDEGRAARFRLTGNHALVERDVAEFTRNLVIAFAIFGLGSLAANAAAILFGLKPLDSVRRSLESIRNGETTRLDGEFPREIQPLANELNALIDTNHRVVERARMQVGNLAHSLKTPLAVLYNESAVMEPERGKLVATQVETMQTQVQTYLDRARIAAQKGSVLARTDPRPVLERLIRVMERLNPDIAFELEAGEVLPTVAMEQQDLEEIAGNLMENAGKFARSLVRVEVVGDAAAPAGAGGDGAQRWVALCVEDDGPGLTEDEIAIAMKRGERLDETKPGTGLGLSIVQEIAREYAGAVMLDRSSLGGLRAKVVLPAVKETAAAKARLARKTGRGEA